MSLDLSPNETLQAVATLECSEHRQCGCYAAPVWGVIQTHPKAEFWATSNLTRQGYRTYLPLYAVKRRDPASPTVMRTVLRPLFTSYAFVQFSQADPWYPIRRTPGVRQLMLSEYGKPHILRPGVLEAVQAAQAPAATQPPSEAQWHLGDAVAPRVGPLAGLPGVVLAVEGENATVGILFLGQLREVVYPNDALVERQDY